MSCRMTGSCRRAFIKLRGSFTGLNIIIELMVSGSVDSWWMSQLKTDRVPGTQRDGLLIQRDKNFPCFAVDDLMIHGQWGRHAKFLYLPAQIPASA